MERYSVQDARHGKQVLIEDENDQAVQLVPVTAIVQPRKAGSARGLVHMVADFDAPLSEFNS